MKLQIKRIDDNGIQLISDDNFGILIICQKLTSIEHDNVNRKLNDIIKIPAKVNIRYAWSNISVFLYEMVNFSDDTGKNINDTLQKVPHTILVNGVQTKGNTITGMYVNCSADEIIIGRKFYKLLIMKRGV